MNTTQAAAAAGGLVGLGLALSVSRFLPAQPDLASALRNLAPENALGPSRSTVPERGLVDRVGVWVSRHAPVTLARVPESDLALLALPLPRFHGQKALYALLGLAFPPVLVALVALFGFTVPVALPAAGSLMLAAALSLLPDYNVRSDAATAREEFTRALGAFIDLVALERIAGAGPRQAMESAAGIGDSWPFRRVAEELARSRWSGLPPWDALARLAEDLRLPALSDLADIMRLSGEEGTAVYQTLRARSAALRSQLVTADLAEANRTAERLTLPGAVLAMSFAVLLTAPALLRLLLG